MRQRPVKEKEKVEELKNQLARALADYDNLRKRVEREKEDLVKLAGVSLFEKLIPVFDMLTQAQRHLKDDGLEHIMRELKRVLEDGGIIEIKVARGDDFDESMHEAVEIEETKDKDKKGKVAEVLLGGWMLKEGPVIRAAKVKVYGDKPEKKEELEEEMMRGNYM